MKKYLFYYPLYVYLRLHALLPLPWLYVLSDILYYPLYYVIRYRRKLVYGNMSRSFPDKSRAEIVRLEKAFYRHFCDYIVETIKLLHISDQEIMRRMKFVNPELLQREVERGNSVLMALGHYGNWEWIPSVSLWFPSDKIRFSQIYRPLKNKWFDDFFLNLRARFDSLCIPKKDTLRVILKYKATGELFVTGFMADQTPSPGNIHHWIEFLHQDTPVLTGVEKIARKTGASVIYMDMEKVKRGYYELTFRLITDTPRETREFEITDRYMALMERSILRAPQYWLWTHKRWKHKRNRGE